MKTRKNKIYPLLLCFTLLISCNGPSETAPDPSSPSPESTPDASIEPELTAAPAEEVTPEPAGPEILPEATPTIPTPTPLPTPTPEPFPTMEANRACMYLNYVNAFPVVVTNDYRVRFHYDDTISASNDSGHLYDLSLSQYITVEGTDLSDPELWYFCGAFQADNTVYAHFNYMNQDAMSPSLLIKIDLREDTADVTCCIFSRNPEKHFQNCFAFTDEYIYYTSTDYSDDGSTTNIMRTDKNGKNSIIFYRGIPGETIAYMTSDENYLSYVITNSDGAHRLVSMNPGVGSKVLSGLSEPDFLIGWNGYVFTSVQNGELTYFDCALGLEKSIPYTENNSVSAGYPLTNGENIYLPLISYSDNPATILLLLDLTEDGAPEEIRLDDTFYYSVGMIDQYLFVENVESYIVFDITGQN